MADIKYSGTSPDIGAIETTGFVVAYSLAATGPGRTPQALVLPPEGTYSETELNWIDNEPPGLFPGDQTSLWGQARKVFADYLQANAFDMIDRWYRALDPSTADASEIHNWEVMLGIVVNEGQTLEARRAFVLARFQRGAFTRSRRNAMIELFITATFGTPPDFLPEGIPFPDGSDDTGIEFHDEQSDVSLAYRVIEDIPGFSYEVRIKDTYSDIEDGLTRELERITPAPITFTLNFVADPFA